MQSSRGAAEGRRCGEMQVFHAETRGESNTITIHDSRFIHHSPFYESISIKNRHHIKVRIAHTEFDVLFDAEALQAHEY